MKNPIVVFISVFLGMFLGMMMISMIFSMSFILAKLILVAFGIALMSIGFKILYRRR